MRLVARINFYQVSSKAGVTTSSYEGFKFCIDPQRSSCHFSQSSFALISNEVVVIFVKSAPERKFTKKHWTTQMTTTCSQDEWHLKFTDYKFSVPWVGDRTAHRFTCTHKYTSAWFHYLRSWRHSTTRQGQWNTLANSTAKTRLPTSNGLFWRLRWKYICSHHDVAWGRPPLHVGFPRWMCATLLRPLLSPHLHRDGWFVCICVHGRMHSACVQMYALSSGMLG